MQDRTAFSRCDIQRGKSPSASQDSRPVGALYIPDHKAYCVWAARSGLPFFSLNGSPQVPMFANLLNIIIRNTIFTILYSHAVVAAVTCITLPSYLNFL